MRLLAVVTVVIAAAAVAVVVLVATLAIGGASEQEVRAACAAHSGVAVVTGNAARKYVTCRDGHYEVVR